MAWTFDRTRQGYGNLWRACAITAGRDRELAVAAVNKILSLESEYRDAFDGNGMPWFFGAAIHYRESSNDLRGCMVNGEKIVGTTRRTTLEPDGRGPYATFKDSVKDAADIKGWRNIGPWSIERFLYQSEIWNGLGYVSKGINAPFVWAGTNHEEKGLYVRDHVFDPSVEDQRLGTAAIILRLMEVRPDIAAQIVQETTPSGGEVTVLPPAGPNPQPGGQPTQGLDLAALVQLLLPVILPLLQNLVKPQQPAPPPVAQPVPQPKPGADRGIMQLGVAGTILSLLTQYLGGMNGPIGPEPGTMGNILTAVPAAIAGVAATGGWGTIASIGARLLSGIIGRFTQPRQ